MTYTLPGSKSLCVHAREQNTWSIDMHDFCDSKGQVIQYQTFIQHMRTHLLTLLASSQAPPPQGEGEGPEDEVRKDPLESSYLREY